MADLYPPIEPWESGPLDVGDGNLVYWEVAGHPDGKPALVLHGGPGSGCTPHHRRFFNPGAYRVVLFDQRGCGRSTPHASDPLADLSTNTTHHLLHDIERLRRHLEVEQWLVFGNSWGSTLALAYAQQHPTRVSELVLVAVGTTRPSEIDWLYHGAGRFFPEPWSRFRAGVPAADRDGNLVHAYHRLLQHPDEAVRERAARDWCDWEDAVVSLDPHAGPNPRYADPRFRMAFARIVTHYFKHCAWLDDGGLLRHADQLRGIPGVMIHGRLDLGSPVITAWELAQAWPDGELIIVNAAGHSTGDPGMSETAVAATDRFAPVRSRRRA
jgi:proline iminopeptidase